MPRSRTLLLAAASALLALPASAQTVDEVIAKHLEARGGKDKLVAAQALRTTGKMTMGPMEAPFTMEWKAPNRLRIEFVVQGQTGIQAFDGQSGWMHMPFMGKAEPEVMPAEAAKDVEEQADFLGPLVDYQSKGHQVELVGKTDVEGTEAYELKITMKGGDVITEYLDAETFLTIKQVRKAKRGDQEVELETTFGAYKEAGGLMLPHSLETKVAGAPAGVPGQSIAVDGYDFSAQIDDSRFAMPEKPAAAKPAGN